MIEMKKKFKVSENKKERIYKGTKGRKRKKMASNGRNGNEKNQIKIISMLAEN